MKTRVVSGKLYVQNEKHGFIKGSLLISSKGFLKSFGYSTSVNCITFEWTSTTKDALRMTSKQARNVNEKYSLDCFIWNIYKETPKKKGWNVAKTVKGWEAFRSWGQASNELTFLEKTEEHEEVVFDTEIEAMDKCKELNNIDVEHLLDHIKNMGIERNRKIGSKFGI
jgi:hypothetical protein